MATPTNLPAAFSVGQVLTSTQQNDLRGAFRVLQVKSTSDTTLRTTTSDYPQVSTLNVSITPQSTSSLILITATISAEITTAGVNPNRIAVFGISYGTGSTTSIFRTRQSAQLAASADMFFSLPMEFLHSPATTSACVYNVLFGRYSGTFNNGVQICPDAGGGAQGRSTITVMEISA
jgi:hypothetical protein